MAAPGVIAFFRTWLRLLTVQACFNYDRMIGVGIGYASEPLLRALPGGPEGERYRAAMSRAGRYFNAHPYLTGLAAGALTRAEHDGVPGEQIERLRTALLGPLGAVGDRLVWAGTLPAASAVGLALSAGARAGVGAAAPAGALQRAARRAPRLGTPRRVAARDDARPGPRVPDARVRTPEGH